MAHVEIERFISTGLPTGWASVIRKVVCVFRERPCGCGHVPLYGYILVGWAAGGLAVAGGWLWGYYDRRTIGLMLSASALVIYCADCWFLFAC